MSKFLTGTGCTGEEHSLLKRTIKLSVSQKKPRRNCSFCMVFDLLMDRIFSQSTAAIAWPLLRHHSFFCFLTKISWKSSPSRPFAIISTLPMKPSLIAEMSGLTSSQFEKSASLTFGFKKKPNQLNPHKLWSFYPNSYLRFTCHDISNAVYYPFLSQGLQAQQYLNCCPWLWEQTLYPELFFQFLLFSAWFICCPELIHT